MTRRIVDFYDTHGRKVARVTEDRALGNGRQPWLDTLADGLLEDQPPSGWTGPARRREQELEAEVRELRRQLHEARQAEQHWRAVARLEDCEVSEDDCEWLRGALKKGGEE